MCNHEHFMAFKNVIIMLLLLTSLTKRTDIMLRADSAVDYYQRCNQVSQLLLLQSEPEHFRITSASLRTLDVHRITQ